MPDDCCGQFRVWRLGKGFRQSYLARVLVQQVERVARELDTAGLDALHEEGILVACTIFLSKTGLACRNFGPISQLLRILNRDFDVRVISQMRSEEMLSN